MMTKSIINLDDIRTRCQSCSLYQLCLPMGLESGDLDELDNIIKRRRVVKKGEFLYQCGDDFHSLFAVRSGSFKSFTPVEDDAEQIIGFHLPGEMIGLDAISESRHQSYSQAMETASVCEIPFHRLEELSTHIPGLQHHLFSIMSEGIAQEHCHVTQLAKRSAEARLAHFLLDIGSRFKKLGYSATEFNLSMSRNDIANLLGLAVETVSRLFTHFQDLGILDVERKHIIIKDMAALRNQAHPCPAESTQSA